MVRTWWSTAMLTMAAAMAKHLGRFRYTMSLLPSCRGRIHPRCTAYLTFKRARQANTIVFALTSMEKVYGDSQNISLGKWSGSVTAEGLSIYRQDHRNRPARRRDYFARKAKRPCAGF